MKKHRVFIVAGEASGDLYGSRLAAEMLKRQEALELMGIGGTAMEGSGVRLIDRVGSLGVVGITEVIGHLGAIRSAWRRAVEVLQEGVDLVVLIDYPDFNLRLAKQAKARGIPVVYYVSPQIWAWRSGRISTIAQRVKRMLVILPFEESLYRKAGVDCLFVGHPLLDEERPARTAEGRRRYLEGLGLDPGRLTLSLLPGSRRGEIERHLPIMLDGMRRLSEVRRPLQLLLPLADTLKDYPVSAHLADLPPSISLTVLPGGADRALVASDAAVVASGTATLHAALATTPMVILYKASWLTFAIGRMLVRTDHVGIVNIVAGRRVVPELIQGKATAEGIFREILPLLGEERVAVEKGLQEVATKLGTPGASGRAAEAILALLPERRSWPST